MLFRHVCAQAVASFTVNEYYEGLLVSLLIISVCHIEHLGKGKLGLRLVHEKHFHKSAYVTYIATLFEMFLSPTLSGIQRRKMRTQESLL